MYNFNNLTNSLTLERGYMATLATNDDGTGKSKVFIASERKIIINTLPPYLKNNTNQLQALYGQNNPGNYLKGLAVDSESFDSHLLSEYQLK